MIIEMELKHLFPLCIGLYLRSIQAIDWNQFSEISITYFKARHVKSVTVINCFRVEDNFQLTKTYLDAGFYVQIVETFDNFNVSARGQSGVAVDGTCSDKMRDLLKLPSINEFMKTNIFWMFLEGVPDSLELVQGIPDTVRAQYNERFLPIQVQPGSRVVVGVLQHSFWKLFDVHKKHIKGALVFIEIRLRGQSLTILTNMERALWRMDRNSRERKNLRGYAMPTAIAIVHPETYTGISDISDTVHDHFAKSSFPLIKELTYDMNFTLDMIQVDQGGWKTNGTFTNGLMGLFQNHSIELSAMSNLMRSERMEIVDFLIATQLLKTCIIFKQPPLSLISNIFELPFSGEIWLSCLGFIFVCWIAMVSFRLISRKEIISAADSLTFIIGTMCQQSVDMVSYFDSPRFLFFTAKLASFFIFTAYSATIVALLQSPSRAITSVADLTASPLKVGAMDTVYVWVYFSESKDPEVQKLFRKKIKPHGKKSLIEPDVGIKRVKDELYAFQVEANAGYHLIKETFTPQDTCKIHELEAIKVGSIAPPIKKGSQYREIFRQRLIWQLEVGIQNRAHRIWVAQKPKCEPGAGEFNSVGFYELRFLCILLGVGVALSFVILGLELALTKWFKRYEWKAGIPLHGIDPNNAYGGFIN